MGTTNITVLHGVEMDVVETAFAIIFHFEGVFPQSRLPDSLATFTKSSVIDCGFVGSPQQTALRELSFEPSSAQRLIRITGWQRTNRMEMIGQQHNLAVSQWPALLAVLQDHH